MPRLIVMRHAKSSWDEAGEPDRERPLNRRGRLAAPLMGAMLAEDGLRPDLALVSSARRTRETWALLLRGAGWERDAPRSETHDALYMAHPETVLALLRAKGGEAETVLVLGHEPTSGELLRRLRDGRLDGLAAPAPEGFPTAAVAVAELPGDGWGDVAFGTARLTAMVTPKSLV